jgi:hypothetical protein
VSIHRLNLTVVDGTFAVYRLGADATIPPWDGTPSTLPLPLARLQHRRQRLRVGQPLIVADFDGAVAGRPWCGPVSRCRRTAPRRRPWSARSPCRAAPPRPSRVSSRPGKAARAGYRRFRGSSPRPRPVGSRPAVPPGHGGDPGWLTCSGGQGLPRTSGELGPSSTKPHGGIRPRQGGKPARTPQRQGLRPRSDSGGRRETQVAGETETAPAGIPALAGTITQTAGAGGIHACVLLDGLFGVLLDGLFGPGNLL